MLSNELSFSKFNYGFIYFTFLIGVVKCIIGAKFKDEIL